MVLDQKKKKKKGQLGMVVHTCNPALTLLRPKGHKFKVSLGYIMRLYQKKGKRGNRGWRKIRKKNAKPTRQFSLAPQLVIHMASQI